MTHKEGLKEDQKEIEILWTLLSESITKTIVSDKIRISRKRITPEGRYSIGDNLFLINI